MKSAAFEIILLLTVIAVEPSVSNTSLVLISVA